MPTVETDDGLDLYYEHDGEGPTVAFVPTAGFGAWQWSWQHRAIAGPYEALVYDLRGTGRSDVPEEPCDVATLVEDLEAILAAAGCRRVHLVGQGLGGVVALAYAHRFDRARSLALFGTPDGTAAADGTTDVFADVAGRFEESLVVPREDPDALQSSLAAVLSADFREEQSEVVDGIARWRQSDDASRDGWETQLAALETYSRDWPLYEVTLPTLVGHGTADEIVPPECSSRLAEELPQGEHLLLEDAGHLVTVERSRVVNDRLLGHLEAASEERAE